jgi:PilZ domain
MDDRRQHPRLPVRYLGTFSTAQRTAGEGVVLDLSLGGCRVESSRYVQPRTELTLSISLPNQVAPFAVDRAVVRWARGRQYGLSFVALPSEEQARLRRMIGSFSSSPPS